MANPFLVLGGIAVGIVTATFGVLQVPGWVASAQDAAAVNDLASIASAQAASASIEGKYAGTLEALQTDELGMKFDLSGGVTLSHLQVTPDNNGWCAIVQSGSGKYFAASEAVKIGEAAATPALAAAAAECETETGPFPAPANPGDGSGDPGDGSGGPGDGSGGPGAEEPEEPVTPPTPTVTFRVNTANPGCTSPGFNMVNPTATINWGDSTDPQVANNGHTLHSYATPGVYDITIAGTIPEMRQMHASAQNCVTEVTDWGETGTTSLLALFNGANYLTAVAEPPSTVTNMEQLFMNTARFNGDITGWDTSKVTTMRYMFANAAVFNQPIGSWDVSSVQSFENTFDMTKVFNQDLSNWDTSSATTMYRMFGYTEAFNQDLSSWDLSNVSTLGAMFASSKAFNSPLNWDTSNVDRMNGMFSSATAFNQNISGWDTSNVTRMDWMFNGATAFSQNLSGWNVDKVTDRTAFHSYQPGLVQPVWK